MLFSYGIGFCPHSSLPTYVASATDGVLSFEQKILYGDRPQFAVMTVRHRQRCASEPSNSLAATGPGERLRYGPQFML
jgi:hypothetical protein